MFICKPENYVGVYMMTSKRTGDTYVGASANLPQRFAAHESSIRRQSWGSLRQDETWSSAFKNVDDIEFRILEFIPSEFKQVRSMVGGWMRDVLTAKSKRRLLNREAFWIAKLNPTLNVKIEKKKRHIEDLPVGPPNVIVNANAAASAR
jgi:hypothetical protein